MPACASVGLHNVRVLLHVHAREIARGRAVRACSCLPASSCLTLRLRGAQLGWVRVRTWLCCRALCSAELKRTKSEHMVRAGGRRSRLYDTALRKDGMYPAADRIKKAKIDFDRKTSDELCKTLNS